MIPGFVLLVMPIVSDFIVETIVVSNKKFLPLYKLKYLLFAYLICVISDLQLVFF